MSNLGYPKSEEADICLILEGTYPFVKGGVSNWIYELIKAFPQYRFAVVFLGARPEDYDGLLYPLANNLVHLETHYLFENNDLLEESSKDIGKKTIEKIEKMHDSFNEYISRKGNDIPELFELMSDQTAVNEKMFLRSKSSWEILVRKYSERYSDQSFFDYFWSVRNLHRPFWDIAKIVNQIPKIKIIHSASTGYAGFLGSLLQKKYQIPYILTEHGIYSKERWIELMRNYFFEYIIKENNQVDNKKGVLAIWVHFFTILSKVAYDAANPIISLIEPYRERQVADGAILERTKIISYGIDFDKYKFLNKKKPNKDRPIIACIGRVVPIKDIKTFIRSCALIMRKSPHAEAWIVGSFQEDPTYVETCKMLTRTFGIEKKVKFLGECNVMDIFSKMDLLLLTSISEGTPFVILESFAVGIPVVATNVGGCKELIYGKNEEDRSLGCAGKLVNISDPDGVANAALELLNDDNAWSLAQKVGYERVNKYYSMEQFIEEYRIIYQEAMEKWLE
jgi:glycosyltransferase involved in cell wall biosynthesis